MKRRKHLLAGFYAIIKRDGFEALTETERGFFSLYWFFIETNNGGLHQFFINTSGELAPSALRYLEQIGASKMADVLRRAITLFPDAQVPADQLERQAVLIGMGDRGVSFDELTNEFHECDEEVADLSEAYIESHPELFARVFPPKKSWLARFWPS